ncbi:PREDICTED: uncharacterized protein LOC108758749 [Trachymyrmex cornetzi]|uniref:uncharacterized protein LOC108758749 n=1 Tax=Trachymyrmex cornetzi TaxID=471704 RepID=UPI00084F809F|nr:PREDICTED: uncharacterized protein LOC108758749 [Trachymyrmex cornetzi]
MDYDKENDINESQSDLELNTNNLHCMDNKNSKEKDKMQESKRQNIDKMSAIGILTSNRSRPLQKRKLYDSLGNNKERKQYKRQESITSKISQYNILADSKIELVQFMVEDLKAKLK